MLKKKKKKGCIHGNQTFIHVDWACVNPTAQPVLPAGSVHTHVQKGLRDRRSPAHLCGNMHTLNLLLHDCDFFLFFFFNWKLEKMLSTLT